LNIQVHDIIVAKGEFPMVISLTFGDNLL
jgi:hypothetical protein